MTSQSTKNSILTLSVPASVIAAGGTQFYEIDASSAAVTVKLPAPVAGAVATFFAIDATNAVTISATTAGTINGSSSESISLENAGDAIALIADSATDWRYLNISTTNLS